MAGDAFAIDPGQVGLATGGGKPLPDGVRQHMEAALGADFSGVRVHVGPQAERIGALAFTIGNDLYFAQGRYQPDTRQGRQLLGHELAHVVQQRQGRVRNPLGHGVAVVVDRALEAEAERLGERAAGVASTVQAKMKSDGLTARQMVHQPMKLGVILPSRGGPPRSLNGGTRLSPSPSGVMQPSFEWAMGLGAAGAVFGGIAGFVTGGAGWAFTALVGAGATGLMVGSAIGNENQPRDALSRLERTRDRNSTSKAKPVKARAIHAAQQTNSYGYTDTNITFGTETGGFHQGYGGQPFLHGKRTNYDEILADLSPGNDAACADAILKILRIGSTEFANVPAAQRDPAWKLIELTQIIESHDSRYPGADKMARALLLAISRGQSTFHECFNRKNGLYVACWNKDAGAVCSGQQAMRLLFGDPRLKSDKAQYSQIKGVVDRLLYILDGNMSESSADGY